MCATSNMTDQPGASNAPGRVVVTRRMAPGACAAVLVAAVIVLCAMQSGTFRPDGPPRVGGQAPSFTLAAADGSSHTLRQVRGRPTLLSFVCGCSACRQLARAWNSLQREHPSVGMVAVTSMTAIEARNFARTEGIRVPVLLDPGQALSTLWRSTECPRCWIIRPDGKIAYSSAEGAQVAEILREARAQLAAVTKGAVQ